MLDVNKYKDAIMDAAWDASVTSIGLDAEDMLDTADFPTLVLGVRSVDMRRVDVPTEFINTLKEVLGESQPFLVTVVPVNVANNCDVLLVKNKKWVYSC